MALFVEDFMEGIMGDAELACHHQQFQDPEQMEMLKEKLCAYFKYKLDGARFYIGRTMSDVHRNLGVSDDNFDSACQIFLTTLKKLKPKAKVMRTFVQRIGAIRSEIVFPPINQMLDQDGSQMGKGALSSKGASDSLFNDLGQEIGMRNIVDSMLEQARVNDYELFVKQANGIQLDDTQLVTKYSMFLSSLLDPSRFEWFHKDLVQ